MAGGNLAKSSRGLRCEGIHLYVNSRVENQKFSNQDELHHKLHGEVEEGLENQNMNFLLQQLNFSSQNKQKRHSLILPLSSACCVFATADHPNNPSFSKVSFITSNHSRYPVPVTQNTAASSYLFISAISLALECAVHPALAGLRLRCSRYCSVECDRKRLVL
jgi:hypothetical protein